MPSSTRTGANDKNEPRNNKASRATKRPRVLTTRTSATTHQGVRWVTLILCGISIVMLYNASISNKVLRGVMDENTQSIQPAYAYMQAATVDIKDEAQAAVSPDLESSQATSQATQESADGHSTDVRANADVKHNAKSAAPESKEMLIQRYNDRVQKAVDLSPRLDKKCAADPTIQPILSTLMNPAMDCLKKTVANMTELVYPIDDAHAHFNEMRVAMSAWALHNRSMAETDFQRFKPLIENLFIDHFEDMYDERVDAVAPSTSSHFCLHEIFGPYIPIFVAWTTHGRGPNYMKVRAKMWDTMKSVMRPDVAYIVVDQNDLGLFQDVPRFVPQEHPNLLMLAPCGYGHVPVPLFRMNEPALAYDASPSPSPTRTQVKAQAQEEAINVANITQRPIRKHPRYRKYVTSYVGSRRNAPGHMRMRLIQKLTVLNADPRIRAINGNTLDVFKYLYDPKWRHVMADSCFSFCPRGAGRASYHFMETLQMGLIPIHVYMDYPWIPYKDFLLREELVFLMQHGTLAGLVEHKLLPATAPSQTAEWTFERILETEKRILSYRDSHFSFEGAMAQISAFMLDPSKSDLQCEQLPKHAALENELTLVKGL